MAGSNFGIFWSAKAKPTAQIEFELLLRYVEEEDDG
jgi:hypothetical protein